MEFRSKLGQQIFDAKYKHENAETWAQLAKTVAEDVCGGLLSPEDVKEVARAIELFEFIPGGRYLYYAGRPRKFFNNCFLLRSEEDSRQDWADLSWKAELALTSGGGIGNDYTIYRGKGTPIKGSGGQASGPISKMHMINEIGRNVMQGGSRRSAIYASLSWQHPDAWDMLTVKDWDNQKVGYGDLTVGDLKRSNFYYPAPMELTNISLNYDDDWLNKYKSTGKVGSLFRANVSQAMKNGEPGFSFNFGAKSKETLRNACCEVTSEDDSDVCNLGSVNMSRIATLSRFQEVVRLGTLFLLCGTLRAELPYAKVYKTREKNRRLGLGLMGIHEWLIARGYQYEVTPELHSWLAVYRDESDRAAFNGANSLNVSQPVARRAIAPTGTIGTVAGTTTGIEPVYATAVKRRYLKNNTWHYIIDVDPSVKFLADHYAIDVDSIQTATSLAESFETRVKFQADMQDYVDMAISSTINLPQWGSERNNEDTVDQMASTIAKYAERLRGITVYPDGARGGQPLTIIPYKEAMSAGIGVEIMETAFDVCDISGKGGSCGV